MHYVSCGSGSQGCQGIFTVTPSPPGEMPSGMMPMPMMSQVERVTGDQPVTVIFIPNTRFMWQGSSFPLTQLRVGDRVMLGYRTLDGMNVVVGGMMVGMRKEARQRVNPSSQTRVRFISSNCSPVISPGA